MEATQKRCTYCFQELCEMTDPRLLPCQHIVCLTCLQEDWKLDQLECRACGKSVTGSIDELPKVKLAAENVEPVEESHIHVCDIHHEGPGKQATSYCMDCGKLVCREHEELHKQFFKDDHKIVSVDVYAEKPEFYKIERCKTHKSVPVSVACQDCDQLYCARCPSDDCPGGFAHRFMPLAAARETLETRFEEMIQKCSDKVTELCKLEKQTWQTVDELNEKCEAMMNQVDTAVEKQIAEIMQRAAELKIEIVAYREDRLAHVENYITDLTSKAEKLEEIQSEMRSFLRKNNTATIVRARHMKTNALEEAQALDTKTEFHHEPQKLVDNGVVRNFKYQYQHCLLPAGPVSIKSTSKLELKSRSPCSTISFIGTPEVILFGCGSVLNAYDHKLCSINGVAEVHSKPLAAVVMVPKTTDIFFIDSAGSVLSTVFGAFYDLSPQSFTKTLFSVKVNAELTLAANKNYLVVSNVKASGKDDGHWLIYNRKSKSKRMYQLLRYYGSVRALKFHPDGDLIALTSHGHVCKCMLKDDGEPEHVWGWYGGATAICVDDKRGLVYAAGRHGQLYAIADGQSVGCIPKFSNDGAPSDMAVYDDMLLVTYGKPNELRTKDSTNEVSVFTLGW